MHLKMGLNGDDDGDGDSPTNSNHSQEDESLMVDDFLDVDDDDDGDNDSTGTPDEDSDYSYPMELGPEPSTTHSAGDLLESLLTSMAASVGGIPATNATGAAAVTTTEPDSTSTLNEPLPLLPLKVNTVKVESSDESSDDDINEAISRSLQTAYDAYDTASSALMLCRVRAGHYSIPSEVTSAVNSARRTSTALELWSPTPKRVKFSSAIDLTDGPTGASSKSSTYFITKALPGNSATTNEKELKNCALYMCPKTPADWVCSGCYSVVYCSSEHQNMHWADHEIACEHFALRRSPQLAFQGPILVTRERQCKPGSFNAISAATSAKRFQLVALVQIPAKERVLDEIPVLLAPWPRIKHHQSQDFSVNRETKLKSATCFGCCSALRLSDPFTCVKCNLPMCSSECALHENHAANECQIIVKRQWSSKGNPFHRDPRTFFLKHSDQDVEFLYEDVMMCRLILLYMREEGKKLAYVTKGGRRGWAAETPKWTSLLKTWKCEDWRRLRESVRGEYVFNRLEELFPLSLFLTNDKTVVWKLFCILETNAFKYQYELKRYNVLCNILPLAHHSCQPNTHTFLEETDAGDLVVRAVSTRKIEKGESITFSYVPLFYSFMERRLLILDDHLFWCRCSRCSDRQDCNLFTASLKCAACNVAYVVPSKELLEEEPGLKPRMTDRDSITSARSEYYESLSSAKYDWACTLHICEIPPYGGSSSSSKSVNRIHEVMTTPQVFRELSWQEEKCVRVLDHPASATVMAYVRSLSEQERVHSNNAITLKLMESILRGDVVDLTNPSSVKIREMHLVLGAKTKMEAFMKTLFNPNPGNTGAGLGFTLEGYPLKALGEIKAEYDRRMGSVSAGRVVSLRPTNAAAVTAVTSARSTSTFRNYADVMRRYDFQTSVD